MTSVQLGALIGAAIAIIIPRLLFRRRRVELPEATPYDYRQLPDDMPSVNDWYRLRVWNDEMEGRSYTG